MFEVKNKTLAYRTSNTGETYYVWVKTIQKNSIFIHALISWIIYLLIPSNFRVVSSSIVDATASNLCTYIELDLHKTFFLYDNFIRKKVMQNLPIHKNSYLL